MQHACLLARTAEIDLDVLPSEIIKNFRKNATIPYESKEFPRLEKGALKRARIESCKQGGNQVERELLMQLMARFDTVSDAAAHVGMQRTYLHSLLAKHSLSHSKLFREKDAK